jgi:hypothetical protein
MSVVALDRSLAPRLLYRLIEFHVHPRPSG